PAQPEAHQRDVGQPQRAEGIGEAVRMAPVARIGGPGLVGLAKAEQIEGENRAPRRRERGQNRLPDERAARQVMQQHNRALPAALWILRNVAQGIVDAAHGVAPWRRSLRARRWLIADGSACGWRLRWRWWRRLWLVDLADVA